MLLREEPCDRCGKPVSTPGVGPARCATCGGTRFAVVYPDTVNHPSHYTFGGIEVIDAIEAWELNFHRGNAVKYVARAGRKGDEIEDLKKARWYLDREIERMERQG